MNRQTRFISLLLVLLFALGTSVNGVSQPLPVVRADPAGIPMVEGQIEEIAILVENVTDLWAFDLLVRFNPDYYEVLSVELGSFLESWFSFSEIDPENGIITYINAQQSPMVPKSGSGELIIITVKALQDIPKAYLFISKAELSDRDGFLIPVQIINTGFSSLYLPLILRCSFF
jgi:hypothetical protein